MHAATFELFHSLIDYAGLFPPAKLPLDRVVRNFAEYQSGDEQWILGRLIVRLDDLYALGQLGRDKMPSDGRGWRVACLLPVVEQSQLRAAVTDLQQFNLNHGDGHAARAVIDTVELKVSTAEELQLAVKFLPEWLNVFLEVPLDPTSELIPMIAKAGRSKLYAKFRTGGVTADLIPGIDQVVEAIATCVTERVGFKATAGLHHPIRAEYALTYEQNAERSEMHGFFNVLAATALLLAKPTDWDRATEAMLEGNSSSFGIDSRGLHWRKRSFSVDEIVNLRTRGMISFGSCSFIEPIEDLQGLGIELTE